MGQINVGGGYGGDAPQEHPQRQCIAWESSEEEECISKGKEEECGRGGAEGENKGGERQRCRRPEGSVIS